jgi:hypothetical protein
MCWLGTMNDGEDQNNSFKGEEGNEKKHHVDQNVQVALSFPQRVSHENKLSDGATFCLLEV